MGDARPCREERRDAGYGVRIRFRESAPRPADRRTGNLRPAEEIGTHPAVHQPVPRQAERSMQFGLPGERHRRTSVGIEQRFRSVGQAPHRRQTRSNESEVVTVTVSYSPHGRTSTKTRDKGRES